MIRLLRNVVLLGALVTAAVLAIWQFCTSSGALSTAELSAAERKPRARRGNLKRWGFRIAGFLVVAAFCGFLFAASGIMSIKASSGHWAITAWLLNFAMRRSVITHALAIEAPPLDDQALVLKGAGHYEIGCRPCHGSPDLSQLPRIAQWMTPPPPNLSKEVSNWQPEELFYIVKHGVKFTGMPAWPAQKRDDEVWAMVAFLLKLPGLNADDYTRLVRGVPQGDTPLHGALGARHVPPSVMASCARCHGVDGSGRGLGAFPKLAGQKPEYFIASMQAYALGRRSSGMMEPIAVALSEEATAELARYYATLESKSAAGKRLLADPSNDANQRAALNFADGSDQGAKRVEASFQATPETSALSNITNPVSDIERGRDIAMQGIPSQKVPACAECHGPSDTPRNRNYPTLAGQYAEYLVLQLTLFKKQVRGGSAYAHLMHPVAAGLNAAQMLDVARYYESLGK